MQLLVEGGIRPTGYYPIYPQEKRVQKVI